MNEDGEEKKEGEGEIFVFIFFQSVRLHAGPSVGRSIGRLTCQSVGPSVCRQLSFQPTIGDMCAAMFF